jgi:transposase
VEGLQAWLEKHPGVEVLTRDRCGIYAEAVPQGAADAVPVPDRFHLFLHLSTAVERALEERIRELCISAQPEPEAAAAPPSELRTTLAEQRKQQRRQRRQQRHERVMELHRLGHTQPALSLEVGLERKTMRLWLRTGQFPERKPATGRRSHVREFHDYLQPRWNEGCHHATRLFHQIRAHGYSRLSPDGFPSRFMLASYAPIAVLVEKEKARSHRTEACGPLGMPTHRASLTTATELVRTGPGKLPQHPIDAVPGSGFP